ncbi:unnamed protein product [Meganyctiphanes norvegica]|uniref:Ran-specific GTPase-activating protein n=1 Tax=Meganyctiphanes norvegica TaxID=48144 RepID=A0AAV2R0K9_MEGNR
MAPEKADPENETAANTSGVSEDGAASENDHDPYFEPVVYLKEIQVKTNEEDEEEMVKLRCKLYRYHTAETPGEWKERGTGDVKILKHTKKQSVRMAVGTDKDEDVGEFNQTVYQCRLIMRQDKTLKIRANHYITPYMELKPNCGSDRAWVWSVVADFADEEPKQECFAIRFANAENAQLFKEKFNEARGIVTCAEVEGKERNDSDDELREGRETDEDRDEAENVTKELGKMSVKSEEQSAD